MADKSKIEWTDATWNPIGGCSIKSPGCAPCYAQQLAGTRLKNHPLYAGTTDKVKGKPVFNGKLTVAPDDHPVWRWPISWRGAKPPLLGPGMPSLIFVGDMSDLFHERRAIQVIDHVVAVGVCSRHICQLLTKRAEVMANYFALLPGRQRDMDCHSALDFQTLPFWNFWLGISAERQREFDERWPYLRRLAAMGFTVFISYEPAIGPLVLPDDFLALGRRAQVIAGGMSGREATPSQPDWFRGVRDQCKAADVPFFFKQWGEFYPYEFADHEAMLGELRIDGRKVDFVQMDKYALARVGKKAAGRLLDGREHNEFPAAKAEVPTP